MTCRGPNDELYATTTPKVSAPVPVLNLLLRISEYLTSSQNNKDTGILRFPLNTQHGDLQTHHQQLPTTHPLIRLNTTLASQCPKPRL